MQTNQQVIDDLTTLLEGCNMGINTFLDYVKETNSNQLKNELVNSIEVFKNHEKHLKNHIKTLGVRASGETKISVLVAEFFEKIKAQTSPDDRKILDLAINGIDNALKAVQDFKKKHAHMNEETKSAVEELENDYKKIYQNLIDLRLDNTL